MRIKDKVCLITGAGSGIGQETALLFAKEGAIVLVNDLSLEAASVTVNKIREANGQAEAYQADVTNEEQVADMINAMIKKFGKIDVLFNNAGISGVGVLHELELGKWNKVMEVNVNSVFVVSKFVVPHMMAAQAGSIINMSSCIAEIGLANRAVYAASKGAILALTKSMQVDYAQHNIRVNALMPGTIFTPFVEDYIAKDPNPEAAIASIKKRQLGGDLGKPIDVAYAALYLASDESRFMMGTPFMIDGGVVNGK
jgi:NAD(P)-dependent dehydrogenase (short-subunit alcohol dehydrogenase family)